MSLVRSEFYKEVGIKGAENNKFILKVLGTGALTCISIIVALGAALGWNSDIYE